jgi:NAD(P)-dependent dehydrogenase (short-subunit alcohol dehydrogenase family)
MGKLAGKIALITGGNSGIGLATARRFVDEGAFVYITGRRHEELDKAVAALGENARAIQGDVSKPGDLDRAIATIQAEKGRLDVVFANAGVAEFAPLGTITEEHYERVFGINVAGPLFTVQKALPLMRSGGSIILTGSTTGSRGTPAFSVYSATKAAIRNFARTWALDLRGTGIRVNVLSPGPTATPGLDGVATASGAREATFDALKATTAFGRLGESSETAAVAAFLASDDSSFMTGSEVFVDGGAAQI